MRDPGPISWRGQLRFEWGRDWPAGSGPQLAVLSSVKGSNSSQRPKAPGGPDVGSGLQVAKIRCQALPPPRPASPAPLLSCLPGERCPPANAGRSELSSGPVQFSAHQLGVEGAGGSSRTPGGARPPESCCVLGLPPAGTLARICRATCAQRPPSTVRPQGVLGSGCHRGHLNRCRSCSVRTTHTPLLFHTVRECLVDGEGNPSRGCPAQAWAEAACIADGHSPTPTGSLARVTQSGSFTRGHARPPLPESSRDKQGPPADAGTPSRCSSWGRGLTLSHPCWLSRCWRVLSGGVRAGAGVGSSTNRGLTRLWVPSPHGITSWGMVTLPVCRRETWGKILFASGFDYESSRRSYKVTDVEPSGPGHLAWFSFARPEEPRQAAARAAEAQGRTLACYCGAPASLPASLSTCSLVSDTGRGLTQHGESEPTRNAQRRLAGAEQAAGGEAAPHTWKDKRGIAAPCSRGSCGLVGESGQAVPQKAHLPGRACWARAARALGSDTEQTEDRPDPAPSIQSIISPQPPVAPFARELPVSRPLGR